MTPQDILNKRFDKGMGGYKAEDVNAFLVEVSDYIGDLQDERADLLEKMEVLAEKLEEYRADEDSLRSALLGAQKLGDSVVRDSKQKAEAILADAQAKADEVLAGVRQDLSSQEKALSQMKAEVTQFREQILTMYEAQMEMIKKLPTFPREVQRMAPSQVFAPTPAEAVPMVEEQQEAISRKEFFTLNIEDEEEDAGNMEVGGDEALASGNSSKKKSSRFTDLQFGEKYNLKREE